MSNLATENGAIFPEAFHSQYSGPSHSSEWLDALKTDNVEAATIFLQSASTTYKDFLMNGDFPAYSRNLQHPHNRKKMATSSSMEFCITKPLHAAAIFHSHGVLRLLLKSGVDVFQVESWQNNVVHMLVYADYTYNVHGTKYAETLAFLQVVLSEEELTSLMVAENAFSLRPLEFAALHGCMGLVDIIMQTRGVYLINEEHVGYNVIKYFDVSEYELFDYGLPPRLFNSPLHFLIFTETSRLEMMGSKAVFDGPVLKSWIRAKIILNCPFVLVWLVFRFLFIGLIFSASLENNWPTVVTNELIGGNSTEKMLICSSPNPDSGNFQWYILTFVSTLTLIYDGYSLLMHKWHHPAVIKLIKRRAYIAHIQFYYWTHFATCISIVGTFVCQMLRYTGFSVPLTIDNIFYNLISCGCMWGVVYFLQLLPWISIYAIAVQRMLKDLFRFALIFVIFLSAFALSFRRILLGDSYECPEHFGTIVETLYSSFLVMINLVNFREYENVDKVSLYILHVVFVFFIPILLINFLIAALTQSFSDVYRNLVAITQTQRLALMITIQMRIAGPMQALYKRLQRVAFVYHNKILCLRHSLIRGLDSENAHILPRVATEQQVINAT